MFKISLFKQYIKSTDTLGFNSLIDQILVNKTYKKEYFDSVPDMYDGLYYTLYYKTTDQKEYLINYIPHHLPDSLRILQNFIDKILQLNNPIDPNKYEFNKISKQFAIELFKNHPPPPPPAKIQNVIFIPAITQDDINKEK